MKTPSRVSKASKVGSCFQRAAQPLLLLLVTGAALSAAQINVLPGGTLTATIVNAISPPAFVALDIEGTDLFAVTDGTTLIGADAAGSLGATFPNETLYAYSLDGTEFVGLTIDDFFLAGTELLVDLTGTPLTPITDPGLPFFEGNLQFDFTYQTTVLDPTDGFSLSSFSLASVSTPEPGTLLFCFIITGAWLLQRMVRFPWARSARKFWFARATKA
jgi:hypothetical protein